MIPPHSPPAPAPLPQPPSSPSPPSLSQPQPQPPPAADADADAPRARAPRTFEQLAALPDEHVDVALGAALIARDAYAGLDVDRLVARFDELAAGLLATRAQPRLDLPIEAQADAVSAYLYEQLGFRGNEQDYYDPRNSLLPDVLDRKLGIPITLALVWCEVARRAGVHARGVSFPGHFLVRVDRVRVDGDLDADVDAIDANDPPVVVDPFFGGRRLDRHALERLLERHAKGQKLDPAQHLAPAGARAMLVRMLINLKWIHATRGDFARALLALDRIISLSPDSVPALRERGALAARLGSVEAARADIARLLELVPGAPDARELRARLEELRGRRSVLN